MNTFNVSNFIFKHIDIRCYLKVVPATEFFLKLFIKLEAFNELNWGIYYSTSSNLEPMHDWLSSQHCKNHPRSLGHYRTHPTYYHLHNLYTIGSRPLGNQHEYTISEMSLATVIWGLSMIKFLSTKPLIECNSYRLPNCQLHICYIIVNIPNLIPHVLILYCNFILPF